MLRTTSLSLLVLLTACGGDSAAAARDYGIKGVSLATGLSMPTDAQFELGKTLFFDPRLSSTGEMSCATCHQIDKAFTDGKKVSPKHDGSLNVWNTPQMYNVGYLDHLYWDGRSPGVLATVNAAWKGQMGGDPAAVASALAAVPGYEPLFQAAYQSGPTADNIAQAMTAFLTRLQSGNSPYDRWAVDRTQDAISNDAKLGEALFKGKAGCHVCHQPPLFTDRTFHNTGIGQTGDSPEPGRGKTSDDPKMQGAFKTPSLRNVALTAPYFHDGSVATLEAAVRQMAGGGIANPNLDVQLQDKQLTDAEIEQLVAFLESLTGVETMQAPTLPK